KTTLVKQLIGELIPDEGQIMFESMDITRLASNRRALLGISRSYQITSIFPDFSVLENVAIAAQAHHGHSFRIWRPAVAAEALNRPSGDILGESGLWDRAKSPAGVPAHGERRQLEIAMALVSRPKLLLLDEPMAGMGRRESESMVKLLAALKGRYT